MASPTAYAPSRISLSRSYRDQHGATCLLHVKELNEHWSLSAWNAHFVALTKYLAISSCFTAMADSFLLRSGIPYPMKYRVLLGYQLFQHFLDANQHGKRYQPQGYRCGLPLEQQAGSPLLDQIHLYETGSTYTQLVAHRFLWACSMGKSLFPISRRGQVQPSMASPNDVSILVLYFNAVNLDNDQPLVMDFPYISWISLDDEAHEKRTKTRCA